MEDEPLPKQARMQHEVCESPIKRLDPNRLSRLFNFCSAKQKLARLRFVDRRFHHTVFTSTSWHAVNTLAFVRRIPSRLTFAIPELSMSKVELVGSSYGKHFKLTKDKVIADYERLIALLCNVRCVAIDPAFLDRCPNTFLPVALCDLLLKKIKHLMNLGCLKLLDVPFMVESSCFGCYPHKEVKKLMQSFWMPLVSLINARKNQPKVKIRYDKSDLKLRNNLRDILVPFHQLVMQLQSVRQFTVTLRRQYCVDPKGNGRWQSSQSLLTESIDSFRHKSIDQLVLFVADDSYSHRHSPLISILNNIKPNTLKLLRLRSEYVVPLNVFCSVIEHIHSDQLRAVQQFDCLNTGFCHSTLDLPNVTLSIQQQLAHNFTHILPKMPNLVKLEIQTRYLYHEADVDVGDLSELVDLFWNYVQTQTVKKPKLEVNYRENVCNMHSTFVAFNQLHAETIQTGHITTELLPRSESEHCMKVKNETCELVFKIGNPPRATTDYYE